MDERGQLGAAIRRARIWRGMTQDELAARVGTTARTIGRWERGEDAPPLLALGPLCDALSVPADYFRSFDERHLLG